MRKRIIIMLAGGLVWVFITIIACVLIYRSTINTSDLNAFNSFERMDDRYYYTDNTQGRGILLGVDHDRQLRALFDSASWGTGGPVYSLYCDPEGQYGKVYTLINREITVGGRSETAWQVMSFDSDLKPVMYSPLFRPTAGDKFSAVWAGPNYISVVSLENNGTAAYEYQISYEDMIEAQSPLSESPLEKGEGANVQIHLLTAVNSILPKAGHFFVQAHIEGGQLVGYLDGNVMESFASKLAIKEAAARYNNYVPTFVQFCSIYRYILRMGAIIFGVGLVIIFILVFVVGSRSRNVYVIVALEVLIFTFCLSSYLDHINEAEKIRTGLSSDFSQYIVKSLTDELGNFQNLDYAADDFYDTQEYRTLQRKMATVVNRRGNYNVFYDVAIVSTRDRMPRVSATGLNMLPVDYVYSKKVDDIIGEIERGSEVAFTDFAEEGTMYRAVAARPADVYSPEYILVGISSYTEKGENLKALQYSYAFKAIRDFFLFSIVVIIFMYLQSLDIRRITRGMREIATGQLYSEKPVFLMGRDLDTLWNAMYEVDKRVRKVNYSKFLIFESYFRFAPKQVERLLDKTSITEVKSGDSNVLTGTMALICTSNITPKGSKIFEVNTDALDVQLDVIAAYQDEEKGVLVSSDCSLDLMEMYFPEHSRDTAGFGVFLMHQLATRISEDNINTFLLLHYDEFAYGVVGNMNQSAAYLASLETQELADVVPWFRQLGLRLLVTDAVKARENITSHIREIGFLRLKCNGKKINLFEILDAESEKMRQAKLNTLLLFNEAMQLYYHKDFYLAVGKFTEIVKKCPGDQIARMYLFECENFIERPNEYTDGALRPYA